MPFRPGNFGEALSETEILVIELIALGKTNAEIGKQLIYSSNTIENYAYSINRKLGAKNRAHAVALAFRKKIIR